MFFLGSLWLSRECSARRRPRRSVDRLCCVVLGEAQPAQTSVGERKKRRRQRGEVAVGPPDWRARKEYRLGLRAAKSVVRALPGLQRCAVFPAYEQKRATSAWPTVIRGGR